MRVGIYAALANEAKPTGIGLHVRNLLNALADIDDQNDYFLYYPPCGLFDWRAEFAHRPNQANFHLRPVRFPQSWIGKHPTLWWKHWLPAAVKRDRLDVFHGPNYFVPLMSGLKCIVTIHDLAYFKSELYTPAESEALKQWTIKCLEASERAIALSENTRRDLHELHFPAEKIRVIYGGGHVVPEEQIQYRRTQELRARFNLPEKYILFVGSLNKRKNVPFLLNAYARLKKQGQLPHGLVLAGHKEQAFVEIDQLIQELGIKDDVRITGYVDDWHLPLLYKNADLFVLPTLYEGFTLVTLEAMAYGLPAIATDTSSIREGVGDAAMLVQVNDVEELTQAMQKLLTNPELRKHYIEQGKVQAQKFTWHRCALDTLELYREVHEGRAVRTPESHEIRST